MITSSEILMNGIICKTVKGHISFFGSHLGHAQNSKTLVFQWVGKKSKRDTISKLKLCENRLVGSHKKQKNGENGSTFRQFDAEGKRQKGHHLIISEKNFDAFIVAFRQEILNHTSKTQIRDPPKRFQAC